MANQEYLDLLKQSKDYWNTWRKQHPEIMPDLIGANFTKADLSGADLSGADLSGADFREANLSRADLSGADLTEANLFGADLSRTYIIEATFRRANLDRATLLWAKLFDTNLSNANLRESDLSDASLNGADSREADLSNANLSRVYLGEEADLSGANLSRADLSGAYLGETNLSKADLSNTDLSGACLFWAYLSDAIIREANLSGADFREANLSRADFSGANLSGADFSGAHLDETNLTSARIAWTHLVDVDLSAVKGLETVTHFGPSSIGIDTIYRSKGTIPEVFLRKAGVPDTFLTYMHSLIGQPFKYFSCFISHSSKDKRFCDRLYADLQANHVRNWYFPADANWSDPIRGEIDRSTQVYDKLIVVCSEHSLQSVPVQREMEQALNREDQEQKNILFPIRIDNYLFECWEHPRKADVLEKMVGDFRGWDRSAAKYDADLKKLLSALHAQE